MNEIIKSLAAEAMGTRKHVPPVWQFFDYELEKFAKLIILKCCEISDEIEDADLPVLASKFVKHYFGAK